GSMTAKVVAIIQARLSSSRQPAKVMLDLCGKTVLQRVIDRVRLASRVDEIWVATSQETWDDIVAFAAESYGVSVFRGSLLDVLDRFAGAARAAQADVIVRCTADNPLLEYRFIDLGVERLLNENWEYLDFDQIPYGAHVWIMTRQALEKAHKEATQDFDREHVCPYIFNNPGRFRMLRWDNPIAALRRPDLRITIDTMQDYYRMFQVFKHFSSEAEISLEKVISFLDSRSDLAVRDDPRT
ncbi:MAG: NTP transferase domain-containing protein, partial [Desulfarculaceae bacterium]